MKRKVLALIVAFLITGLVAACGSSYYMITEPKTQKVYYTDKIDEQKSGAIKFKDALTQDEVTIQNSEVKKITKDEYKMRTVKE